MKLTFFLLHIVCCSFAIGLLFLFQYCYHSDVYVFLKEVIAEMTSSIILKVRFPLVFDPTVLLFVCFFFLCTYFQLRSLGRQTLPFLISFIIIFIVGVGGRGDCSVKSSFLIFQLNEVIESLLSKLARYDQGSILAPVLSLSVSTVRICLQ